MAGRILLVDDVATNRIVMKVKLASAFYDVLQADSAPEAERLALDVRPDLIILDAVLRPHGGADLCHKLKSNPHTRDIPIIVVTSLHDRQTRLAALDAGADEFLTKPLDELSLLARVRSLLRARATSEELRRRQHTARELGFAEQPAPFTVPGRVAIITAETDEAIRWREQVRKHLRDRVDVIPAAQVLEALNSMKTPPDAFVISTNLAEAGSGLRLLAELRSREQTRHSAILIVHEPRDRNSAIMALDLGANDLLARGFDPEELALRLRGQMRRKQEGDRLRTNVEDGFRLAVTDPLTGLYNRRYAMPHLGKIAERARAQSRSYAIMLVDLDRFKFVNDTYGHAAGDRVLVEVAKRLKDNVRSIDLVARVGGEEFLIALPDTDLYEATVTAERLRRIIQQDAITLCKGQPGLTITASIGVAMGGLDATSSDKVEAVMNDADRALYDAKAEGRNQVSMGRTAA